MARTWSVCMRGIALRGGALTAALREQIDRAFLGLAVVAHLCISLLGAGTLAVRAANAERAGSALFEPSVLLFLLAGGSTALLLLHMSRSMALRQPDRETVPALDDACAPMAQHRRVMAAFTSSGIPFGMRTSTPAFRAAPDASAFDGLMDSVGHELRTPLNAIIGFSELMQRELLGPLGPRYQDYVRHIRDSGLAVLKAAEETMALTSLLADRGRARTQAVELDALLDETCRSPEARERGIRIVRGAPCQAMVRAEPAALRQSLANLIAAAVLRAPEHKPISMTTRAMNGAVALCMTFTDDGPDGGTRGAATRRSMAVARMLFELQGVALTESRCHDGAWRVTAILPLADFSVRAIAAKTCMARTGSFEMDSLRGASRA